LDSGKVFPDKDFVLLVSDCNFGEPTLISQEDKGDQAFILSFFPDFRTKKMK